MPMSSTPWLLASWTVTSDADVIKRREGDDFDWVREQFWINVT